MKRCGLALVLVSGVLAVLASLGSAFVLVVRLERRAAAQRIHAARAHLLARAGVEDAMARLDAGQDPVYAGEDYDADGHPLPGAGVETQAQVFNPAACDRAACPVAHALRPSFAFRGGSGGILVSVDGRSRGVTSPLGYALKVEDESGKLDVNGGLLDGGDRDADGIPDHRDPDPGAGWNAQMVRVLDLLGAQAEVGVPGLGTQAIQSRPLGGYDSVHAVEVAVGTLRDLSPYLTTRGRPDASVIRPKPGGNFMPLSEVKKLRGALVREEGGRPPVNLNTTSRPVLVALLSGLRASTWQDPHYAQITDYEIDAARAEALADAFMAWRPFGTWGDFEQACDRLVADLILTDFNHRPGYYENVFGGGNLAAADLLKAHFDPNTRLVKQIPDQLLWRWIDKSDLAVWSTEGCLASRGAFRIGCVGRILSASGELLAASEMAVDLEAYRTLQQTTQADFIAGRADPATFLSRASPGSLLRTHGASAAWRTWGGHPDEGLAVVTYPCPPGALPDHAADFDGSLALATVELRPLDPTDPPGSRLMFLQHFDDSWDAEILATHPAGDPMRMPGSYDALLGSPSGSVWPASPNEPNTLYPDGAHVQPGRSPGYPTLPNLPPFEGAPKHNRAVFGYWVKPLTSTIHTPMDLCSHRRVDIGSDIATQTFGLGRRDGDTWGFIFENRAEPGDYDNHFERQSHVTYGTPPAMLLPGLRWHWVTLHHNSGSATLGSDVGLSVRGLRGEGEGGDAGWSLYPYEYTLMGTQDIRGADVPFVIGCHPVPGHDFSYANHLLDEFAVLDLQDDPSAALLAASAWGLTCYQDGRYYKGNDGCFLSGSLVPDGGAPARLRRVSWTAYLPSDPRQEIAGDFLAPLPDLGVPRLQDATLAGARVVVELLDAAGTLLSPPLRVLSQGEKVGLTLPAFRYRVRFEPTPSWTPGERVSQPLLETPVLDDISISWVPAAGPRVEAWERR